MLDVLLPIHLRAGSLLCKIPIRQLSTTIRITFKNFRLKKKNMLIQIIFLKMQLANMLFKLKYLSMELGGNTY